MSRDQVVLDQEEGCKAKVYPGRIAARRVTRGRQDMAEAHSVDVQNSIDVLGEIAWAAAEATTNVAPATIAGRHRRVSRK